MTLTKIQLRRAARAARGLAMECVNGTAPRFGTGSVWDERGVGLGPGCAIGHVAFRATGTPNYLGVVGQFEVERANDEARTHKQRMARLVFPLLALADVLDEAAVNAAEPPSKNLPEES